MRFAILAIGLAAGSQSVAMSVSPTPTNTADVATFEAHEDTSTTGSLVRRNPAVGVACMFFSMFTMSFMPGAARANREADRQKGEWAYVRLHVGLPTRTDKVDPSTGGNLPDVVLYDQYGKVWGENKKERWRHGNQGGFHDYEIKGNNQRPTYIKIHVGPDKIDAICISAR